MSKTTWLVLSLIVFVIAISVYFSYKVTPDLQTKGIAGSAGDEVTVAWLALLTAIASFLSTLVASIAKIVEALANKKSKG